MSIKLSRRKIQQMIDADAANKNVRINRGGSSSGGESGGGSGGGGGVTWWQYSPTNDTITFIKKIANAVFDRLRVTTKLIFGNSDEADTYVTGIANNQTAETSTHDIVTPNYGKEKYLSKTHADTAQGWITILQGIRTLETFLEGASEGGGLFTDSQNRAQLVADVAKIRDKVLGSLTIEDALSVLGSLNVHNSSSQGNSFADGTTISNYIAKLNGNARIDETLVALAGMYVNVVKSMNYNGDGPFDAGWMMTNNKNGHSYLVVDELFVRMKAIFTELEIRKISYAGGNFVFSHAGSKIVAVKSITKQIAVAVVGTVATITGPVNVVGNTVNIDGGVTVSGTVATLTDNPVTYAYRCYAMKDDGTTATENWWHVNDQARCQTFNVVEPGHYENIENTFYWRRILNVGYEKISLTEGQTEEDYDFIDMSVADCASGSDAPKAGDSIVQMGNRTDTDRMGFISLEVYGDDAPAIKVYKNVNGYTLTNKRKICISPKYTELHLQKMVIETEYDAQPVAMERGPWDDIPGHRCYYFNVVQHNGSSWLCIYPEEGIGGVMYTTEEPSETATYWQYYAKAGKDGKDGTSFNLQGTVNSISELPATGEEGQAWIVKINGVGYLYVWDVTSSTWKESGQIQGDPGRGIQSVTISYGNSDSPSTLPATWGSGPSPQQGKYLWTRTILNYTDNTSSEPSYSVSYNGTDGTSPIMISVDNPIMSVACDKDGHALEAFTKTVVVTLYNGNELVALTGIDCTTATGISVQNKSAQSHSFQIAIAQGAYIYQANNLVASATATIDGDTVSRSIPITVNGIRQGADGLPAAKVELNDYMVDVECDENGNATETFSEEIIPQILADNKQLYISSISVGSHANVSTPSYYASPLKPGVMSVSGTVATINGVSMVSGTVATLPSTVIRLPHIVVKVAKGGTVTEGNVNVNVTGADNNGTTYSAGNNFAIVRNYYAPALQVVLSPEVIILTQNEQTNLIDLSEAYTDVLMRIGGTDITNGLDITAEVSEVGGRPTCTATVSGNRVTITAINTTTAGSGVYFDKGYIDINITYKGNVYTQRFSFYCNLLGTWKQSIEGDMETITAQKISYVLFNGNDTKNIAECTTEFNSVRSSAGQFEEWTEAAVTEEGSYKYINKHLSDAESDISDIVSEIGDPSNPAAGTILKRMSTIEQTAGEIKLEVQGQTGVNLLNSPTDLCSSAAWERMCYLYSGNKYTVSIRFVGHGQVDGTLSGLMTNPPADRTITVGSGYGAEVTNSVSFTCSKTGWYRLSFPVSTIGEYIWAQVEYGEVSYTNVVYHSANDYLSKTGIDIVSGQITLTASRVYIMNNGQPAALFTDGKIKGQFLQVGGFTIDGTQIKSDDDKIILNKAGTAVIGKMSVDANGNITATDVDLTGKITATSGKIGNFLISNGVIKSSESSPNILLDANGQSKIGKMTVALNGDITVSNMTANDGIFKGVIRAEKGLAYKIAQYTIAVNESQNMSNDDVVVYVKTTGSGGLGNQLPKLYLPNPEYGIGQMVYICNREGSTQTLRIMASNSHNIYPGNYSYIDLVGNGVICFVFDYVRGQWWQFSALNT